MSLTTVTDAIQAFLFGIPGITYVYQEMPWQLTGDAWQKNAQPGTVGVVHIDDMDETRISAPAIHGGQKEVTYQVRFLMLYQYKIPSDLGTTTKDVWSVGQKALVSAVVDRLRSDPTFGCGQTGPIYWAADGEHAIHTAFDMPVNIGPGTVVCWTSTEFVVREIVTA